jgi:hypothetical protein
MAAGTSWEYAQMGVPGQFRGLDIVMEKQQASSQTATGVLVTTGLSGNDATSIEAGFKTYAHPGTSPKRAQQRYGFQVEGPAQISAFFYRPWVTAPPYSVDWEEWAATVTTDVGPAFGTDKADKVTQNLLTGVCKEVRDITNTVTRARYSVWFNCPGTTDKRQQVEVAKHPVVLLARAGDTCDAVCTESSLQCDSWRTFGVSGTILPGGACSVVVSSFGGYCHCGMS